MAKLCENCGHNKQTHAPKSGRCRFDHSKANWLEKKRKKIYCDCRKFEG